MPGTQQICHHRRRQRQRAGGEPGRLDIGLEQTAHQRGGWNQPSQANLTDVEAGPVIGEVAAGPLFLAGVGDFLTNFGETGTRNVQKDGLLAIPDDVGHSVLETGDDIRKVWDFI